MTNDQYYLMNYLYDEGYFDITQISGVLYNFSGMGTVIDYMEKYHPEVDWGRCEPCDNNDVPLTNIEWCETLVCLVCGSTDVSVNGQLALF